MHDETDDDTQMPVQNGSVWAQMREAHKAISEERTPLTLPLPGYAHVGVGVRYHYVAITGSEKIVARLQKIKQPTRQAVEGAAATIAMACDAIMVLSPDAPEADDNGYVPLVDSAGDVVRFDQRLCVNMGLPTNDAQGNRLSSAAIVRQIFGGTQGEHALIGHAREVAEWMAEEREQVGEDFLGK